MAYYEFPRTRNFDTDVSFLIDQYKELISKVDGIQTEILANAKAYTDSQIVEAFKEVNNLIDTINKDNKDFIDKINLDILLMQQAIKDQDINIDNQLTAINDGVDLKILQNNDYIFSQIAKDLIDVKVINFFTGEATTIQDMFNYLANFHVDNAITYDQLYDKAITFNGLYGKNITYTDIAINGNIVI